MKHIVRFVLALGPFLGACSSTPGDAALRSEHPQQAARLYRLGADQGDASAALKLGRLIESGQLRDATYGVAGAWYVEACDLGDVVGCHNAGVGFEYGTLGLAKSYEEARSRYLRAARGSHRQSDISSRAQ